MCVPVAVSWNRLKGCRETQFLFPCRGSRAECFHSESLFLDRGSSGSSPSWSKRSKGKGGGEEGSRGRSEWRGEKPSRSGNSKQREKRRGSGVGPGSRVMEGGGGGACVSPGSRPALDRSLVLTGRELLLKTHSFEVQTRCFQSSQFLIICAGSPGSEPP